jgi:hypothetical protein
MLPAILHAPRISVHKIKVLCESVPVLTALVSDLSASEGFLLMESVSSVGETRLQNY